MEKVLRSRRKVEFPGGKSTLQQQESRISGWKKHFAAVGRSNFRVEKVLRSSRKVEFPGGKSTSQQQEGRISNGKCDFSVTVNRFLDIIND